MTTRCLAFLVVLIASSVGSRVIFDYSFVVQAGEVFGPDTVFACKNACRVYVDQKSVDLWISSNGTIIADFATIMGNNDFVQDGLLLQPGDNYTVGSKIVKQPFAMYVVDSEAPNFGSPVYYMADIENLRNVYNDSRFFTVIIKADALRFSGFQGIFPDGYPRIYTTGFDSAGDERCRPVYQARSQSSAVASRLTIPSIITTVDFGFVGTHIVSLEIPNYFGDNCYVKRSGESTVYMSPGYVGCSYNLGWNYAHPGRNLADSFDVFANQLDFDLFYYYLKPNEPLNFHINDEYYSFYATNAHYKRYYMGQYRVNLNWLSASPNSGFAMQMDWDVYTDATMTTTTNDPSTTKPMTATTTVYCDCSVDKFGLPSGWQSTDIWLDIAIVLDTSEAMGESAVEDAATLIESLIGDDDYDVLITDTRAPFYTRIGVISMSDTAEVLFNLNMTKEDSITDKVRVSAGVSKIDVMHAFDSAVDMFAQGLRTKPERASARQVIYYLTDSDAVLNATALDIFKQYGMIMVEQFAKKTEVAKGLDQLASNGYFFKTNERSPIQVFCEANCFCPLDRTPYSGNVNNAALFAAGGCFHAPSIGLQYSKSVKECANNRGRGQLVSVHDQNKAEFLNDLVASATDKKYYFWIGYSKGDDGVWRWEDQSTDPFTNWDKDEPSSAAVSKCAYVDQTQPSLPWGAGNCQIVFPYVCEYAPCAVGNNNC